MHGVPWSHLTWEVTENRQDSLVARFDWTRGELLAVFPYRHQLELTATLRPHGLAFETTLNAGMNGPVPVSFGFHPYLGLPGLPRAQWRLTLPPLRKLVLDPHGIPTGEDEPFGGLDSCLGERDLDDGFALPEERLTAPTSALTSGRGLRLVQPGGKFRAAFRVSIGTVDAAARL
jgi:galactose mutarotase-like enzyme